MGMLRELVARVWPSASPTHVPAELHRRALQLCRGDANRLERLVALEIERRPGLSRKNAVRRVVESIARDNR